MRLVNAGGGYWDDIGLPVGWPGLDGKSGGSRRLAANHPSPSWDGEGTLWEWRRSGDCYRVIKKIIIFYNMKCKDILDKKLRVVGENEIAWHESRWNVGLLSDSDRSMVRSLWFICEMLLLDRAILIMIDCQYEKVDWSSWWVLPVGWHEDMIHVGWWVWNLKFHDMWIDRVDGTGMTSDGNGGDGGECYRIEESRWVSKK